MTASRQPNLLFILPDQLRPDFLGCYGGRAIRTPHIDALAADGVRFTDAVSTSPVCVPARASLLTGLDPFSTGVIGNGLWLRPDRHALGIETWPEILGRAGYRTAAIGKMHFYPWDASEGFQERVIADDKRHIHIEDDYAAFLRAYGHRKYHGSEHEGYLENQGAIFSRVPRELTVDRFVGRHACEFLAGYREERPFALMVGLPSPHCPYDPLPESVAEVDREALPAPAPPSPTAPFPAAQREAFLERQLGPANGIDYREFAPEQKRRVRAHYAGLVKQVDDEVGAILAALRTSGRWDDTVVIFASDHGDLLGDHDLIAKANFYEGSCRIPLIVRAPGLAPSTCGAPVELTDLTSTLLTCAGVRPPNGWDSIPLPGFVPDGGRRRTEQYGVLPSSCMLRSDGWKLIRYDSGESFLFHHAVDPGEQRDLKHTPEGRERFETMDARLNAWLLRGIRRSVASQRVTNRSTDFGKRGWHRPYPAPVVTQNH